MPNQIKFNYIRSDKAIRKLNTALAILYVGKYNHIGIAYVFVCAYFQFPTKRNSKFSLSLSREMFRNSINLCIRCEWQRIHLEHLPFDGEQFFDGVCNKT